jgi:hypothetical protein
LQSINRSNIGLWMVPPIFSSRRGSVQVPRSTAGAMIMA